MDNYRLSDLLEMNLIQTLADSNFRATGLPMSIIDALDTSILVRAGWTDICMNFHRTNPASLQRCIESDASIKDRLVEGEKHQYKCKNGLWHVAIPIMVSRKHLATMFLTQFYFEGEIPEREFFIRQGQEFGYDLEAYLAALDRLPVFSREKVDYILAYDQALVKFISDLAMQSLQVKKAYEELEDRVRERTAELAQANQRLQTLVNESEQRNRQMTLLQEMNDTFHTCRTASEYFETIAHFGPKFFPGYTGALYTIDNTENLFEMAAGWGETASLASAFGPEECWGLRRSRAFLVDDPQEALNCPHLAAAVPAAYLCLPLMALGKPIGLLHLQRPTPEAGEPPQSIERYARSVAEAIAMALANLKLRSTAG
jgi:ligand-binding sensor protein